MVIRLLWVRNSSIYQGYTEFVSFIQEKYQVNADLKVFLVCGPLIGNPCCTYVQNVAQALSSTGVYYIDLEDILTYPTDYGCDGHPNVSGHAKMAAIAGPFIQKVMGW